MEMLREMGFCSGIENYSRILDGRKAGERPYCLLDYFPDDFVCFIDESHQTVPQIGGMSEGDRSRKQTLVDYGFRLPSALDNRPQTFQEFLSITPQMVFVSATPGEYERTHSQLVVEQIVRPTGIVDPEIEVRETKNQIDDLMNEIKTRVERDERTLVTTLTKKMSEDLTDYLLEMGFKVRYLHSEVDTLERIQIIRELRLGDFDVLVGVNLLREGLDLPEVSLVAILDADKEGFLRGATSLIQTIGRAARNVEGRVLMYADKESAAMKAAIEETDRRRAIQVAYNEQHGITPETITKGISDIAEFLQSETKVPKSRRRRQREAAGTMPPAEIERKIVELEEEMLAAAEDLRFEYAARLRDEIRDLKRELDVAVAEGGSARFPGAWRWTGRASRSGISRSGGVATTRPRSTRTLRRSRPGRGAAPERAPPHRIARVVRERAGTRDRRGRRGERRRDPAAGRDRGARDPHRGCAGGTVGPRRRDFAGPRLCRPRVRGDGRDAAAAERNGVGANGTDRRATHWRKPPQRRPAAARGQLRGRDRCRRSAGPVRDRG